MKSFVLIDVGATDLMSMCIGAGVINRAGKRTSLLRINIAIGKYFALWLISISRRMIVDYDKYELTPDYDP